MKKLLFLLFTAVLITFTAHAEPFRVLNHDDEVRLMDFDDDGTFTWITYENLDAYATANGLPENYNLSNIYNARPNDVVLFYDTVQTRTLFRAALEFSLLEVDVTWDWVKHPHVHFLDFPNQLGNDSFHPSEYADLIALMQQSGYYDPDAASHPALLSLVENMQEMIDNARGAWGLEVFPDSAPAQWVSGTSITGEDWFHIGLTDDTGEYHQEFFIARIDIHRDHNTTSPDESAAFRPHYRRRLIYVFDSDDLALNKPVYNGTEVVGLNSIQIVYSTKTIFLAFETASEAQTALNAMPRFGWISLETGIKWYIARITQKYISEGATRTITFRCDPQAKKGTFGGGESVKFQLSQGEIQETPSDDRDD